MTTTNTDVPGTWAAVDSFLSDHLLAPDEILEAALATSAKQELPDISVSPLQGALLQMLAGVMGASRVLEIGTLGGYSTICLARGIVEGGYVVTLELEQHHAVVARANIDRAGLSDRVEIKVGPASASLARLQQQDGPPFDLVFIDADKVSTSIYFEASMNLTRQGGLIIVDNVVRAGDILDESSDDESVLGIRAFLDSVRHDDRLEMTAIQTVGAKGYDGLALLRKK